MTRRKVIYSISSEMNETSKKKMLRCSSLQQHGNVHFIIQCSVCAAFVTCWERDALIVQPGVPRGTWGFLRGQLRAPAPTLWMNPPEIELKHVRAAAHPTLLMCRRPCRPSIHTVLWFLTVSFSLSAICMIHWGWEPCSWKHECCTRLLLQEYHTLCKYVLLSNKKRRDNTANRSLQTDGNWNN